jgi:multiple sugar transport system substrate-binding protein
MKMFRWSMVFPLAAMGILVCGCGPKQQKQAGGGAGEKVVILWTDWEPARYLRRLSQQFTKETGIAVDIVMVSWETYHTHFFSEMKKRGETYDLIIGDSQWLGTAAKNGYYIELTGWIRDHGVDTAMTPASITGYAEYPKGGGRYWAIPCEGDAMGFAYRKDLFENEAEKRRFAARYGYALGVPATWSQVRDIAEFFNRPKENFYGIALRTAGNYDEITMTFENLLWAFGADLGSYADYRVKGILNSGAGKQAMRFFRDLNTFGPPPSPSYQMNPDQALRDGKVAMMTNFFAFLPSLADPARNPHAAHTGFFAMPSGPGGRFCALGGQGISLVSYSQRKEAALQFLSWFVRYDTQRQWADLGGYTCDKRILNSGSFLSAKPYNRAFMESMQMIRDFWSVPEYPRLLDISQYFLKRCVVDNDLPPSAAADSIALGWERTFEDAGYYRE